MTDRGLPTLASALEWAEKHWDTRQIPTKLVDGKTTEGELGGLAFTPPMARHLDAHPGQVTQLTSTITCYHPTLTGTSPRDCRECFGAGAKTATRFVYRYPMWRALNKLRNALVDRHQRNQPHPYGLVMVLAGRGWDARAAAETLGLPWDYAEAAFLRSLRQLHQRYEEGPVDTRRSATHAAAWTEISVSQQNALAAGETAA